MTRILGDLEKGGLVLRAPREENRREVVVSLTEAGKQVAADVHSGRDEWLANILEQLPRSHRDTLVRAVDSLELMLDYASSEQKS